MFNRFAGQRHQLPIAPDLFGAVTEREYREKGHFDYEMDLGADSHLAKLRRIDDRMGADLVALIKDRESSTTLCTPPNRWPSPYER